MMTTREWAGLVGALVFLVGCAETSGPAPRLDLRARWIPDSTAVLAHAYHSGFTQSSRAIVSDAAAWATAWSQFRGSLEPAPSLPVVDFDADVVIVAALGPRPTGGYDIRIDSVANHGGTVVYVTTLAPGPTCITTQAFTSPAVLVRLPRPADAVAFQDRDVVIECP